MHNLYVTYHKEKSTKICIWHNGSVTGCDISPDKCIYNIDHTKVDINRLTLDEWTKYVQDLSCLQWGTSQLPKNPYISFYLKVNPFRTCERWWIENAMKIWNKFIHFFTQSHNKSTNERGYTPEVLHFCFTNPDNVHFIEIWHKVEDPQSYRVLVSF